MDSLSSLVIGFGINLLVTIIIVRFIYYPRQRDKDYVFTFFAFNTIMFFLMRLFNNSTISIGVGFGLFAIFSMLRYRTNTIPIREMTYLFVIIALPVINSILLEAQAYSEAAITNVVIVVALFLLEQGWGFHYQTHKSIIYERIDMIQPHNRQLLIEDLELRTGLPIDHVEVGNLNFLRDSAKIKIYYDASKVDTDKVKFVSSYADGDGDDD